VTDARIPVLPRGVRLHYDKVRAKNVLLAPERALFLDDIGHAILSEIDGQRSIAEIARHLAAVYSAPQEAIASDIMEFVDDLADKRVIGFTDA
jgi:pyrroloquinoline quinone biosynthesis protein D